jgi:excisionase family DNA binding protein
MKNRDSLSVGTVEAARIIGICRPTLIKYIHEGRIPCRILSKRKYLLLRSDLEQFLLGMTLVHDARAESEPDII